MNLIGWFADYPDPYDFINILLYGKTIAKANNINTAYFDDPVFNRKMEEASRLVGPARAKAYAQLDADLTLAAPFAVYGNSNAREFVSERIGCPMYSRQQPRAQPRHALREDVETLETQSNPSTGKPSRLAARARRSSRVTKGSVSVVVGSRAGGGELEGVGRSEIVDADEPWRCCRRRRRNLQPGGDCSTERLQRPFRQLSVSLRDADATRNRRAALDPGRPPHGKRRSIVGELAHARRAPLVDQRRDYCRCVPEPHRVSSRRSWSSASRTLPCNSFGKRLRAEPTARELLLRAPDHALALQLLEPRVPVHFG